MKIVQRFGAVAAGLTGLLLFVFAAYTGQETAPVLADAHAGATGSATPTPAVINGNDEEDGGSDVDILRLALLTIGASGIAGVLALIGYVVRKRIGYEPHAPHEGEEPPGHH